MSSGTSHSKGQTWAALKKCWKAYRIAKAKNERDNMFEYAKRIRSLQTELELPTTEFSELDPN